MAATCFVQPLDLVKNRMQLAGKSGEKKFKSSFHALSTIVKNEGVMELYNGLSAGLLRQATYTTTRLGIYTWMLEKFTKKDQPLSFPVKASLGMGAGACGALVGTPAELALIRMTGDGHLPPEQRRNYKNVVDALIRVIKEEGVLVLFRGCTPTVIRAMVVNAAQLATYSQAKQMILATGKFHDVGLFRIQAMKIIDGVPEYTGPLDVCIKVRPLTVLPSTESGMKFMFQLLKKESVRLWKGFTPYYMRLGPHTVLTFIFLEQFNRAYIRIFHLT
ncbi:hypothetical protein OSTOST_05688, partial [Ostertagia ostertagi]